MTGGQGRHPGGGQTPGGYGPPQQWGAPQGGPVPQGGPGAQPWGVPQGGAPRGPQDPQAGQPGAGVPNGAPVWQSGPVPGQATGGAPQPGHPAPGPQGPPQPSLPPAAPQGHPQPGLPGGRAPLTSPLADGEWHRLHPLTLAIQLVRLVVGIVIAVFAIAMQQLGRRGGESAGDFIGLALVGVLVLIVVIAVFNVLGYRATTFRVTHEAVEMRTGVLNKQHRIARLDRVQDIVIVRPFLPGLFGVAQAEVGLAGDESKFALSFLKSTEVDALRAVILQRASGAKQAAREQALGRANGGGAFGATPDRAGGGSAGAPGQPAVGAHPQAPGAPGADGLAPGGAQQQASAPRGAAARATDFFAARIEELTGPELSPGLAKEHSVVRIPAWRLIVAGFVNPFIVLGILALFVAIPVIVATQAYLALIPVIPFVFFGLIGGLATLAGQVLPALNYSIAGTPDGVRVGQGFLSTTNDTIPPGRVHAVLVSQPLWWRPFGWWTVRIARAGQAVAAGQNQSGGNAMSRNVLLPVGTREEVDRVLALILPTHMGAALRETVDAGLTGTSADPRFVPMPSRAWPLHPISFTRIGFRLDPGGLYSRGGLLNRWMSIVPAERIQGVRYEQSWLDRLFGVADLRMGVVGQFLSSRALSVDAELASRAFDDLLAWADAAARLDTSHRWREAAALTAVASARMQAADAQREGRPVSPAVLAVLQAERETEERFGAEAFREGRRVEEGRVSGSGAGFRPGAGDAVAGPGGPGAAGAVAPNASGGGDAWAGQPERHSQQAPAAGEDPAALAVPIAPEAPRRRRPSPPPYARPSEEERGRPFAGEPGRWAPPATGGADAPRPAEPETPGRFGPPAPPRGGDARWQAPTPDAPRTEPGPAAPPAWQQPAAGAGAAPAPSGSAWAPPGAAADADRNRPGAAARRAPEDGAGADPASTSAPLSRREARAREAAAATGALPVANGEGASAETARPMTRREQREAEREAEARRGGERPGPDQAGGPRT